MILFTVQHVRYSVYEHEMPFRGVFKGEGGQNENAGVKEGENW